MKRFNKEIGITLIALVISIIVLLILAGVGVQMLTGENGILNKAGLARDKYTETAEKEDQTLEELYSKLLVADSESSSLQNVDITTLKNLMLNVAYPVGSIYISTTDTNPATILGGEWESYGEGRTLVGAGTGTDDNNESKTFTTNSTGGEYNHTLTIAEMPSHTHNFTMGGYAIVEHSDNNILGSNGFARDPYGWWYDANKSSSSIASSGDSQSHNIIQPYIVTYMWKRTK